MYFSPKPHNKRNFNNDNSNDLTDAFKFFIHLLMRFQNYDALRIFTVVARHGSFASAAEELNLTKGAISYQIRILEEALKFQVFHRLPRGIALSTEGQSLFDTAEQALLGVEYQINALRSNDSGTAANHLIPT
jgi:DNA-binding transcriptional LysR family regulator